MFVKWKMPLNDFIDKLLKGEEQEMSDSTLQMYVDYYARHDAKGLQQLSEDIDKIVKERYVFSNHASNLWRMKQGCRHLDAAELEDLGFEESLQRKAGKVILSLDFLYGALSNVKNLCEAHWDVIERAYETGDIDYLYSQWKELIFEPQIGRLRMVISKMSSIVPTKVSCEAQRPNRPEKQLKDYPDVFGVDVCCEITGYSRSTIYKLTSKHEMPCFRQGSNGRVLMFKRDEILEWMTARRQETTQEFIDKMTSQLGIQK